MIGRIQVITGCMFSGKTEEMIRLLIRHRIARRTVQLFKPHIDNRYSEGAIVSHNRLSLEAIPIMVDSPADILLAVKQETEIVGIDEAQFFSCGLIPVVETLSRSGVSVLLAGLKQDFRGESFGPMGQLLVMADEIVMLTAICNVCGSEATMTQRLINGQPAPYSAPQVLVGGTESYEARCREHHVVVGKP